jgi:hypothetical protein
MKRLVLSLFICSSAQLFSMQGQPEKVDFSDVESMQTIKNHVQKMTQNCSEKCSFTQDVMTACFSKCMEAESKRAQNYVLRRYVASCQGVERQKPFNFKPTIEEEIDEVRGTINAIQTLERRPDIQQCATAKLVEHHRRMQSLQRVSSHELDELREEHPVISRVVDGISKLRRHK